MRQETAIRIVVLGAALVAGLGFVWMVRQRPRAPEAAPEAAAPAFEDATLAAGFMHTHQKPKLDPVLEPIMPWVSSVGAAAAAGDYDRDGWMDLYVTDSGEGRPNHLYRNRGDGTFENVAEAAGVARANDRDGTSMDCVWGDYDNDGWPDLYVVKWGRDLLYRNRGDGTFEDVTLQAFRDEAGRPGSPWANGCAALWFDYDGDARLDLYVGNYFAPHDLWHLETTHIMHDSFEESRNAGRNSLYRNRGDGTFEEVGARLGVDDTGWTLSVGHGDVDNDGWPDLYCANDFGPDQLFLNSGDGTFRNVTSQAIGFDTKKGMNVDFGDYDNDGWLDIYVTNITTAEYLQEGNMLWHNDATGEGGVPVFLDVSVDTRTYDGGWGWGAKFVDYDNDADLDIVSLNGFISAGEGSYWYDLASWTVTGQDVTDALAWPPIGDRSFSGNEATRLWRNDGGSRFVEIAAQAGADDRHDGRGVVAFDADNDGDLDLYLANQGAPPRFLRNVGGSRRHWLGVQLRGRPESGSNRDAVGARVTAVTRSGQQIRELDGGNSYSGQSDRRLYFGLGDETQVQTLQVRWPSRREQTLHDVAADQVLIVEEPAELATGASLVPRERGKPAPGRLAGPAATGALAPADRDAMLERLETLVRNAPADVAAASRYRATCVDLGAYDRSIDFFETLLEETPAVREVRLQLAAAYVDAIPRCGGKAAIVCKGRLARRSLDQMDRLIDEDPAWWPAVYARAMNHLHWPRALRHSDDAAADFRRCIDLQRERGGDAARLPRIYAGLGDALVKGGDWPAGRDAWREGLSGFPDDADLRARAAIASAEEARAFVEEARSLEHSIDTDFSFLAVP